MNLKRMAIYGSLLLGSVVWTGAQYADNAIRALDYNKINQNIDADIKEVLPDYASLLSQFSFALDTQKTNINEDHFVVNVQSKWVRTAWSDKAVDATGALDIKVRPDGKSGIDIAASKSVIGNPVALFQHLVKTQTCPVASHVQGVARILAEQDCMAVTRIAAVADIASLRMAITSQLAAKKAALQKYLTGLSADQKLAKDATVSAWIAEQITKTNKVIATLDTVKIVDAAGGGFTLTMGECNFLDKIFIRGLKIDVSATSVSLMLKANLAFGDKLYMAEKPELVKLLRALESNETYANEMIKMRFRVFFNLISEFMSKKP